MSIVFKRFAVALSAWMSLAFPAAAEETFVLSGVGGRLTPVTFSVQEGSELSPCAGSPQATMIRCLLFDLAREDEIKAAYRRQVESLGWTPAPAGAGARPGLEVFRPVNTTDACPPVVMLMPATGSRYAPAAIPEGKAFYAISYAPDLMCAMGRRPG